MKLPTLCLLLSSIVACLTLMLFDFAFCLVITCMHVISRWDSIWLALKELGNCRVCSLLLLDEQLIVSFGHFDGGVGMKNTEDVHVHKPKKRGNG